MNFEEEHSLKITFLSLNLEKCGMESEQPLTFHSQHSKTCSFLFQSDGLEYHIDDSRGRAVRKDCLKLCTQISTMDFCFIFFKAGILFFRAGRGCMHSF